MVNIELFFSFFVSRSPSDRLYIYIYLSLLAALPYIVVCSVFLFLPFFTLLGYYINEIECGRSLTAPQRRSVGDNLDSRLSNPVFGWMIRFFFLKEINLFPWGQYLNSFLLLFWTIDLERERIFSPWVQPGRWVIRPSFVLVYFDTF